MQSPKAEDDRLLNDEAAIEQIQRTMSVWLRAIHSVCRDGDIHARELPLTSCHHGLRQLRQMFGQRLRDSRGGYKVGRWRHVRANARRVLR